MDIITLNVSNIENEHICCVLSDKKGDNCIASKKTWLKERFDEGLVFKKLNVKGKVFIEYVQSENAWCPIVANEYMFINCLWVSGKYKNQGYSNSLLNECILDSKNKGKKGIVILSSKKKMPFLSESEYLKYKGFKICDTSNPYYELLFLPFTDNTEMPRFKECAKKGETNEDGLVLYYSNQCPYAEKYVNLITEISKSRNLSIKLIKFKSSSEAQNAPSPFTTYSLFYNKKFITHEILSEKKFIKFLDSIKI